MLSDIGSPGTSAWANSLLELNQTSVARDWRASAAWLHDREAILRAFEDCPADLWELRPRSAEAPGHAERRRRRLNAP
jgi:hypothetical protein